MTKFIIACIGIILLGFIGNYIIKKYPDSWVAKWWDDMTDIGHWW
jgi:plastocyanin domain-containing protein